MKIVAGWHCPEILGAAGKYLRRAQEDAPRAFDLCAARRVAIQAGGHVGTWPAFLSGVFETVYTFEPVAENFACLTKNILDHGRGGEIFAARGALGDKRGPLSMVLHGKCAGQHRARYPKDSGLGAVPVYRIDDLSLPVVDAIFLDVEGFEIFAIRGALKTLEDCRPVVMAENNRRAADHGFGPGDMAALMKSAGYVIVDEVGEDLIFAPAP